MRGLTLDKGMIIAVKQIELNHFDRDKAMKVCLFVCLLLLLLLFVYSNTTWLKQK